MNFFGFKIKTKEDRDDKKVVSVVTPNNTDGSIVLDNGLYGSAYNLAFDIDGQIKNELELIRRYRELANYPEVSEALEDIVNEAISVNPDEPVVTINMDSLNTSATIKKKISDSLEEVCSLLEFNDRGHEIFERWYVDGKIYYQVLIDVDKKVLS